jgi:hypothetical protein
MREWLGVALGLVLLGALAGPTWNMLEVFDPPGDYRIPFDSSDDYWLFNRYCREVGESEKSFTIGDSFVWGQYVDRRETLSQFLNLESGTDRFANAGLDGAHPLALEGLIKHYCGSLRDREVILHLNLLWMSSPQADLQVAGPAGFNHPRLVPQFAPAVPGHTAGFSERLGIALTRDLGLFSWSRHIQSAYYSNADVPGWTLQHPYFNPLRQLTLRMPGPEDHLREGVQAWFVGGSAPRELSWVDLGMSHQWRAFRRLVATLLDRGNRVFVLVGPLNEHMMEPASVVEYREILVQVQSWLNTQGVPHFVPQVLPSHLYADMSHPMGEGYALLARTLWEQMSG